MAAFHYPPLHSSPFGRTLRPEGDELPVAERVAATLVRLPIHPLLSDEDVGRVVEAVRASLG
jgi:dTDP-4-amino-4,6-dideoxygalactose transaminase